MCIKIDSIINPNLGSSQEISKMTHGREAMKELEKIIKSKKVSLETKMKITYSDISWFLCPYGKSGQ